jgi:hypothetical protein
VRSKKEKRFVRYNSVVSDPSSEYEGNMVDIESGDVYYKGKKIASKRGEKDGDK